MSNHLINDRSELVEFFAKKVMGKYPEFAYISSKVRKDVLIGEYQGKFVQGGTVKRFVFENTGGGVYKVTVGPL